MHMVWLEQAWHSGSNKQQICCMCTQGGHEARALARLSKWTCRSVQLLLDMPAVCHPGQIRQLCLCMQSALVCQHLFRASQVAASFEAVPTMLYHAAVMHESIMQLQELTGT